MAGRFYRHDVGITPDQIRAARQIRLARTAARGSFAVWLLIVLLVLIPLPFGARLPEPLLAAIVLVGAGLLMAAGAVTLTLAFSRGRLSDGDRFHARVGRLALLLPVVMLAGVALAEVTGAGIWTVGLLTVLMIAVALSDKALDRLERHGRHTESRVCVIDLESGERIWHRHSDLRAVDEAAEIVAVHDAELGEGLVQVVRAGRHDHPVFTRVYDLIVRAEDGGSVGAARQQVCSPLTGRTLIVGLGPGLDLRHLPTSVTEVVAVEPSRPMRRTAEREVAAAAERGLAVDVIDGVAEDLPFADGSFDSVLLSYVLCTVDDPDTSVSEVRRVLRPGGRVCLLEHVKARPGTLSSIAQRTVRRVWPYLAGGCRCDRDTRSALHRAGFDVSDLQDVVLVNLPPVAPVIMGTAVPVASSG